MLEETIAQVAGAHANLSSKPALTMLSALILRLNRMYPGLAQALESDFDAVIEAMDENLPVESSGGLHDIMRTGKHVMLSPALTDTSANGEGS